MKNSTSREVTRLEAAMAERAPVIEWRLDPVRRVQVAWYVDDPYMEGHHGEKTACKRGHPLTEDNTTPQGRCRTCKNELDRKSRKPLTPEQRKRQSDLERQRRQRLRDESPLIAAARTEI